MSAPTPPPAIDDATRAAVLAAECAANGHIYRFDNMLCSSENGGSTDTLGAQDPAQLPHITCKRCPKVWIVIEAPGDSYAQAITHLSAVVTDRNFITPRGRPKPPDISQGNGHGH